MGIILWIVFGALVGWIASALMKSNEGVLMDIIIGIVGAVIGGWIFAGLGIFADGFLGSLAAATIGAIMLVATARLFDTGHISMP